MCAECRGHSSPTSPASSLLYLARSDPLRSYVLHSGDVTFRRLNIFSITTKSMETSSTPSPTDTRYAPTILARHVVVVGAVTPSPVSPSWGSDSRTCLKYEGPKSPRNALSSTRVSCLTMNRSSLVFPNSEPDLPPLAPPSHFATSDNDAANPSSPSAIEAPRRASN